jgi:hypothetical protein
VAYSPEQSAVKKVTAAPRAVPKGVLPSVCPVLVTLKVIALVALSAMAAACQSHTPPAPAPGTVPTSTTSSSTPSAPRTMHGARVTLSANYPTVDDVFTNTVTGTVPASWPEGTLYSTKNQLVQVHASFDVTDTTVTETFLMNAGLGVGTFNGPVYKFQGAPPITNVTVDPNSDPGVAPKNISFTADSISVNDSGGHVTNGAKQILDVTFGAS